MLTLLFGPSGVGKTSIISRLVRQHGWRVVESYITRPARPDELFKTSVTMDEYQALLRNGRLFSHVEQHGHCYGTLAADIDGACTSPSPHVLDFGYEFAELFAGKPVMNFIIMPATSAQLTHQLENCGRSDRIAGALRQLATLTNADERRRLGIASVPILINGPDGVESTVDEVIRRTNLHLD